MLVRPDGTYVCALSGGCLEPAVAEAAARVIATGEPALVSYDLADDSIWSLNIGCSGAVDIRIERIDDDEVTTAWLDVLERGTAGVLVTVLADVRRRRLIRPGLDPVGSLGREVLDCAADRLASDALADSHATAVVETIEGTELLVEISEPGPRLVIFGAGQDAAPLATQAWTLGFEVTVVDPRNAYLQAGAFPHAHLVLAGFDDLPATLDLPRGAFTVIMSHHMERDRLALAFCLERDPAYVGVLGPRARYERLLAQLRATGLAPEPATLARVHSPVGLALGAETPEEVAVSIVAEMLAVRRGFGGGFLTGAAGALHRSSATRTFARS
jgi:xanthine/CO dehydrogenase XdhC/CoxF family maturation factor